MRVTKGHSGNRRAHHALKEIRLSLCSNCGEKHERHKVCLGCGFYKDKQILNGQKKIESVESKVENKIEDKVESKTEVIEVDEKVEKVEKTKKAKK
jgi:large subunit ribosomal protein L32